MNQSRRSAIAVSLAALFAAAPASADRKRCKSPYRTESDIPNERDENGRICFDEAAVVGWSIGFDALGDFYVAVDVRACNGNGGSWVGELVERTRGAFCVTRRDGGQE